MTKVLKEPSRTRNVIKHRSTLHTVHERDAKQVPHWQWSALLTPLGKACFRDFNPWKASCGLNSVPEGKIDFHHFLQNSVS